ncbi:hypothetical protein LEP1GSC073_4311 [Leptospira noguchii str. Cascata]|nr:hypothetical protein LEP1GSC073_4311 [Leptospira noguchii str. Cascata]
MTKEQFQSTSSLIRERNIPCYQQRHSIFSVSIHFLFNKRKKYVYKVEWWFVIQFQSTSSLIRERNSRALPWAGLAGIGFNPLPL